MLKKTVVFKDFNGVGRQEDVYFNISKDEVIRFEMEEAKLDDSATGYSGGFSGRLIAIGNVKDGRVLMELIDEIMEKAYGVKSDDGMSFDKDPALYKKFKTTPMYNVMMEQFLTDAGALANFVNNVLPAELMSAAKDKGYLDNDGNLTDKAQTQIRERGISGVMVDNTDDKAGTTADPINLDAAGKVADAVVDGSSPRLEDLTPEELAVLTARMRERNQNDLQQ